MKFFQWESKRTRVPAGRDADRTDGHGQQPDRDITYEVVGRGMPVLLLNGLGGSREIWEELIEHLQDRYRFIAFDYAGLRAKAGNGAGAGAAYPITVHARDAQAVLDAEEISRCAVVGWSMGVPVALELFSQAPSRVSSLVLLCGAAQAAWTQGSLRSLPALTLQRVLRVLRRRPGASHKLLQLGLQSPEAFTWARRLGLMGEQISSDAFARMAASVLEFDFANYVTTLDRLSEFDASSALPYIDVPTLVIGGGHDPFTTRASLEALAQGITGAEYLFLPEGTHYLLLDQAEWVNLRIEKFWNERGYAAA